MLLFGNADNPFSSEYISEEYLYLKSLFSKKQNDHLIELLNYLKATNHTNWKIDEIFRIDNTFSNNDKQIELNKINIYLNYKYHLAESKVIENKQIEMLWNLKTLLIINDKSNIEHKEINLKILVQLADQILEDLEVTEDELRVSDMLCNSIGIPTSEFATILQSKIEPTITNFVSSKSVSDITEDDLHKIRNYYQYLNNKNFKYDDEFILGFLNDYNSFCIQNQKELFGINLDVGYPSMVKFPIYGALNCKFSKLKKVQGQSLYEQNPARIFNYKDGLLIANKYAYLDALNGVVTFFSKDDIKESGEREFLNTGEKYLYIQKKGERNPYAFSDFDTEKHYLLMKGFTILDNEKQIQPTKNIIEKENSEIQEPNKEIQVKADEDYIAELNNLVGIDEVKTQIASLANFIKIQNLRKKKDLKTPPLTLHSVFTGAPGTGKTTVARLYGGILKQLGILKKGHLVEVDRSGLVAGYLGQTALKVDDAINKAIDGILFIDEAYSLTGSEGDSYGSEAVEIILKRMEDNRDRLVVILAGYNNEMEKFIDSNPGLKSRFTKYFNFKDYSPTELMDIFCLVCKENEYSINEGAKEILLNHFRKSVEQQVKNLGNGRYVRNLFERIVEVHSNRIVNILNPTEEQMVLFTDEDVDNIG